MDKQTQQRLMEELSPGQSSSSLKKALSDLKNVDISLQPEAAGKKTLATVLGEIVWLLTQSPAHKHFSLTDLEWLVMPAILLDQYKIYRNEEQVTGAALWAYLSPEAEKRLLASGRIAPQDWGNNAQLSLEDGLIANEGGQLWLIELLAPFNSPENNHQQQMLADLMLTSLKGKLIKIVSINPETGNKETIVLGK